MREKDCKSRNLNDYKLHCILKEDINECFQKSGYNKDEFICWLGKNFDFLGNDYSQLDELIIKLFENTGYGTSEYGGPVWVLDFSFSNLAKTFPTHPWVEFFTDEHIEEAKKSGSLRFDYFCWKVKYYIKGRVFTIVRRLGINNVIIKTTQFGKEKSVFFVTDGKIAEFLTYCIDTCLIHHNSSMLDGLEREILHRASEGCFPLMVEAEECILNYPVSSPLYSQENIWSYGKGNCEENSVIGYILPHWNLFPGAFVEAENDAVKVFTLIVHDLMEGLARGEVLERHRLYVQYMRNQKYSKGFPDFVNFEPFVYPKIRYDKVLSVLGLDDARNEVELLSKKVVKFEMPKIDKKYGEFWHRQFPLKQNWNVVKPDNDATILLDL